MLLHLKIIYNFIEETVQVCCGIMFVWPAFEVLYLYIVMVDDFFGYICYDHNILCCYTVVTILIII